MKLITRTWQQRDLGLNLCYGYEVGKGFGNVLGFLRLHSWCSPPVFCTAPGYEWLNWEVIDAGCQVALEECHRNASCQWFEWPWRPCRRLSLCPSRTAVLTPLHPLTHHQPCSFPQKPASLEVNKCPAGQDVFWKSPRVLLANGMKHTDMSNSHLLECVQAKHNIWPIYSAPTLFLRASLPLLKN